MVTAGPKSSDCLVTAAEDHDYRGNMVREYSSPLDPFVAPFVELLQNAGVETFESCDGGDGHAYPEPSVRFHGDRAEGMRALSVAIRAGLPVYNLNRVWRIEEGEPTGPWWELVFLRKGRSD